MRYKRGKEGTLRSEHGGEDWKFRKLGCGCKVVGDIGGEVLLLWHRDSKRCRLNKL